MIYLGSLSGDLYQPDRLVLIDSWIEVIETQFIPSIRSWLAPYLGKAPFTEAIIVSARKDGKALIKDLDGSLKKSRFICGDSVTISDISLACELVQAFRLVLDENTRKGYSSVVEWMKRMFEIPEFKAAWGEFVMCTGVAEIPVAGAEIQAEKPVVEKKQQPKKVKKEKKDVVVNKEEQERIQRERAEKKQQAQKAKLEQEEKKKLEAMEKKEASEVHSEAKTEEVKVEEKSS